MSIMFCCLQSGSGNSHSLPINVNNSIVALRINRRWVIKSRSVDKVGSMNGWNFETQCSLDYNRQHWLANNQLGPLLLSPVCSAITLGYLIRRLTKPKTPPRKCLIRALCLCHFPRLPKNIIKFSSCRPAMTHCYSEPLSWIGVRAELL